MWVTLEARSADARSGAVADGHGADRADRSTRDAAPALGRPCTAAHTCSSESRAAATSSRRRARRSTIPSGSRGRRSSSRRAGRCSSTRASSRSTGSSPRAARSAQDGRRLLLRRPTGFDLHSVREYEEGESLRKVHWPTTARRGQLMVKELEDAPRDEIAVLLDADANAAAGESFDVQVRAAGSILRAHASHGRRAVLAVNSARRPTARVSSLDGDWLAALALLAEAEPDGTRPIVELLARESGPASRALETVVVTARVSGALATRLVAALAHRARRERGLDRRAELRRAPDDGRARPPAPAGRRRRRGRRAPRRLTCGRPRRRAGDEERSMVRTDRRLRLPGGADRARVAAARGDASSRRRTGSGSSCSRWRLPWRRRSRCGSRSPSRPR